jgi:hypothetical protein
LTFTGGFWKNASVRKSSGVPMRCVRCDLSRVQLDSAEDAVSYVVGTYGRLNAAGRTQVRSWRAGGRNSAVESKGQYMYLVRDTSTVDGRLHSNHFDLLTYGWSFGRNASKARSRTTSLAGSLLRSAARSRNRTPSRPTQSQPGKSRQIRAIVRITMGVV